MAVKSTTIGIESQRMNFPVHFERAHPFLRTGTHQINVTKSTLKGYDATIRRYNEVLK